MKSKTVEELIALGRISILEAMEAGGPECPFNYSTFAIRSRPAPILPLGGEDLLGCLAILAGDFTDSAWASLTQEERETLIDEHVGMLTDGGDVDWFVHQLFVYHWKAHHRDTWGPKHTASVARICAGNAKAAEVLITAKLNREGSLWRAFWKGELRRRGTVRYQLKTQAEIAHALADHFDQQAEKQEADRAAGIQELIGLSA